MGSAPSDGQKMKNDESGIGIRRSVRRRYGSCVFAAAARGDNSCSPDIRKAKFRAYNRALTAKGKLCGNR